MLSTEKMKRKTISTMTIGKTVAAARVILCNSTRKTAMLAC